MSGSFTQARNRSNKGEKDGEGDIVLKKLPPGRVQLILRVGSWKHSVGGA